MKKDTFPKKLVLNKSTVSHLNEANLDKIYGGARTTLDHTCGAGLTCLDTECFEYTCLWGTCPKD